MKRKKSVAIEFLIKFILYSKSNNIHLVCFQAALNILAIAEKKCTGFGLRRQMLFLFCDVGRVLRQDTYNPT